MPHFSFCGEHTEALGGARSNSEGVWPGPPPGVPPPAVPPPQLGCPCALRGPWRRAQRGRSNSVRPEPRVLCGVGSRPGQLPCILQTLKTSGGSRPRRGFSQTPAARPLSWCAALEGGAGGPAVLRVGCCAASREGWAACAPPTVAPSPPGFPRVNVPHSFKASASTGRGVCPEAPAPEAPHFQGAAGVTPRGRCSLCNFPFSG